MYCWAISPWWYKSTTMTSSNECLKSLPVCGGCETPPRAWGVRKSAWLWRQTEKPSEELHRPCHVRAEFLTHTEFARWSLLLSVCSATDRWLVKVIPIILITETRATFGIGCGSCTVVLRLLSTKTISAYLVGLTLRLLTRDHYSTLINSDCRLLALKAGMMMYM